ncbi:MAG: thiamine pyrophosphate-binding protein [Proteobacteria bacterium]|nr:thiamine pyrophosphate-binding protein [Pseudomonadota bacterium]
MTDAEIDRRELLPALFPAPGDTLMVSGLAGASRDAAALTGDGDRLFTMAGTMGAAVPLGPGIALSAPGSQVAAITGDGELLMDLGALATVATQAPDNLSIICIDNGRHGETGGQLSHTSHRTDLARIAEGAGLASVMAIGRPGEIAAAATFLAEATAPRFLLVRVKPGPPAAYKRDLDPAACRLRFRNAYLDAG